MATAMSSTFTAADRRKRVATYGKSSRMAPSFNWGDDAPSPERPRKQTISGGGTTLKRPASGTLGQLDTKGTARKIAQRSPATRDVFDVPSDDDLPSPKPIKKPIRKQASPADVFNFPPSNDETGVPQRKRAKTPQPLRKPEPARRVVAVAIPKKLPKPDPTPTSPPSEPEKPLRPRAKTPQVTEKAGVDQGKTHAGKKPVVKPKPRSRATTPAPLTNATQKKGMKAKPLSILDVFDVPSSDEDTALRTPRKPPPAIAGRKPRTINTIPSPGARIDSDGSNSDRKRKRETTAGSKTGHAVAIPKKRDISVPSRDIKHQKIANDVSAVQPMRVTHKHQHLVPARKEEPSINNPKRTRVRPVTTASKPAITKTQSSPANLHDMLALRSVTNPSPVMELPETMGGEDEETMYDIQEVTTPLVRPRKVLTPGSATPTQQQLLSSLVEDTSNVTTPGMPSIRRLQLTDQKPRSILTNFARSSSDVPQSACSRKPRLIDTLKQAAPSSTDEEEDSDSGEESEDDSSRAQRTIKPTSRSNHGNPSMDPSVYDDMDLDTEINGNSQASQVSISVGNASKVTYAKQRSYREEGNQTDDLLLAMELDDPLGFGFASNKTPAPVSDDDEEEASQVRGIHELRRKGQNQKFLNEIESAIDDIAGVNNLGSSMRRSAMLELSTRMADQLFVEQFLESGLGARFLESISSQKEVIFDFAASVALCFIMSNSLGATVLDDIQQPRILNSLIDLLDKDTDIERIARDRKTNMSKVGRESVKNFRILVQQTPIWAPEKPENVSPQVVALKALELLVLGLRKAGNTEAIVNEGVVLKILDIATGPNDRLKLDTVVAQDSMTTQLAFSIMEAVSMSKQKQATWSNRVLQRLVELMPVFFDTSSASPIKLAVRLCMNLTNNKPKACEAFAGPAFVQPLAHSIRQKFQILAGDVEEAEREEVLEGLILCLGAMINLAEFSDQARQSVVADGDELVDALVKIFLEGSERAAQADSLEASHTSVTVGYLTVLLGNLCLNDLVRHKVRSRLPSGRLDMLVEQIREFVRYNERVDHETNNFEGDEGRETWRNFTKRLLLVVQRLEKAER